MTNEFWEVPGSEDYMARCDACAREKFAKDNPTAMIPANAIAHTCNEKYELFEKVLVCNRWDEEMMKTMVMMLMSFVYRKHPFVDFFKIRLTDSTRALNAKELIMQWAVEKSDGRV